MCIQILKLKTMKKLMVQLLKRFNLFEDYENIKLPEKLTFKKNKNIIKSNTSKKNLNLLFKKQKNTSKRVIFSK